MNRSLRTALSGVCDDLWMIGQSPALTETERAECYDMADRCAEASAFGWSNSETVYSEADLLRSRLVGKALSCV